MKNKNKRRFTYKGKSTKRVKKMRFAFYLTVFIIFLIGLTIYQKEYLNAVKDHFRAINTNLNTEIQRNQDLKNQLNEIKEYKELSVKEKIRKIAKNECDKRGLENYCIDDLIAIAWAESRFNEKAIGDFGVSFGCYQIHSGYHKNITQDQAEDLKFAVNWTLNRMLHYGYPEYRSYAIMKHNGTPNTKKTLSYLESINNYINN